jgi:hypothetical protein
MGLHDGHAFYSSVMKIIRHNCYRFAITVAYRGHISGAGRDKADSSLRDSPTGNSAGVGHVGQVTVEMFKRDVSEDCDVCAFP